VILASDDSIVLPDSDDGALVIDATPLLWDGTTSDLLSLLPGAFRGGEQIDRDAVLQMIGALSNEEWARVAFVLEAQQSPRFADGPWLDWWGDILGRRRQPGETEAAYRARLLVAFATITPDAIKGAVDAIVATLSKSKAIYEEPAIDAAFCGTVDCAWQSFTQPANRRLLSNYPGAANASPPSYAVPVTTGGLFWIILPADSAGYDRVPFASPLSGGFTDDWQFVAPATSPPTWAYGYTAPATSSLGDLIISEVERRIASGTAYFILFDPLIANAI